MVQASFRSPLFINIDMAISLRLLLPKDDEFLLPLYGSAREMDSVGWNTAQKAGSLRIQSVLVVIGLATAWLIARMEVIYM